MMKKLLFTSALAFIAAISFSFAQTKNITIPKGQGIEYVIGSKMEIDFKHSPNFEKDLKALLKSCFTPKDWNYIQKNTTYIEILNTSDLSENTDPWINIDLKKKATKGNIFFRMAKMSSGNGMVVYSNQTIVNTFTGIAYLEDGKTKKLSY